MSWLLHLLDGLEDMDEPELTMPAPPPAGHRRLHLFAGDFGSREAAEAYCYDAPDATHPEPLTRDLPGAYIDPDFVEIAFGTEKPITLGQWFDVQDRDDILADTDSVDTILIVDEHAFGGQRFYLNDTPVLRYLGGWIVRR